MSATTEIDRKAKEKRDQAREDERKGREKLQQVVEKGRQREYLTAPNRGGGSNLAQIKGIKTYLNTLEESGYSKTKARALLKEDDKTALAEHEFIESQKKKYGRA